MKRYVLSTLDMFGANGVISTGVWSEFTSPATWEPPFRSLLSLLVRYRLYGCVSVLRFLEFN
jgi:hypothetical protein